MTTITTRATEIPFAQGLSKGSSWFDKLTTNGVIAR